MSVDSPPTQPDASDLLVDRCLQGDQSAWEALVRQYRRKVFNVAYKFVGRHDEAEDLTQDIFLKIFRSLSTFDRRANFQTWLISISRNLCIDHYRSVRMERQTVAQGVDPVDVPSVSPDAGPDHALEHDDRRALVQRGLDGVQPSLRTAVVLRDIQELTYQEIADRLRLPEGTVKSRINRGRIELARQIRRIQDSQAARPRPARARRRVTRPSTGASE